MAKISLTSADDKPFMSSVSFPVELEAELSTSGPAFVRCDSLLAIGAKSVFELQDAEFMYGFTDFEIVIQ